jgi:hypothetical protein
MAKTYLAVAFVAAALALVLAAAPAHAEGMTKPSSGGSLNVSVDPEWLQDGSAKLKVSFFKPDTTTVQEHIDYDVIIKDSAGKQVFSASGLANASPPLHTAEGVVTIPATFGPNGDYQISVEMYGILFNPINPETAEFSVNVTPEFPVGAMGAVAAVMAGAIAVFRLKKL